MSLIQVKVIEGAFSQKQKQQVIEKVTNAIASIEGNSMRPLTWVILEEMKAGECTIEGKPMDAYDIQVKVIEGAYPPGQKQKVIEKLTDTMASIWGKETPSVKRVKVDEMKSGEWGIGGKLMTTYEIMALAAESYDRF
jgi:4-oxalocrotonate tautomerase